MGRHVESLVKASSTSLAAGVPEYEGDRRSDRDLRALLLIRNGFYAFDSALHVFGSGPGTQGVSLEDWNATTGWIPLYEGLADGIVFFAEDVFGHQFGLARDAVVTFDPETGQVEHFAETLEAWAGRVLLESALHTGQPLARAWEDMHGQLSAGKRLVPKVPFVLGGEFSLDNLAEVDALEGMRFRASIAMQIQGLTDGGQLRLRFE